MGFRDILNGLAFVRSALNLLVVSPFMPPSMQAKRRYISYRNKLSSKDIIYIKRHPQRRGVRGK